MNSVGQTSPAEPIKCRTLGWYVARCLISFLIIMTASNQCMYTNNTINLEKGFVKPHISRKRAYPTLPINNFAVNGADHLPKSKFWEANLLSTCITSLSPLDHKLIQHQVYVYSSLIISFRRPHFSAKTTHTYRVFIL